MPACEKSDACSRPAAALSRSKSAPTPDAHGLGSHGWTDAQVDAFAQRLGELGFAEVRVERDKQGRHVALCAVATNPA